MVVTACLSELGCFGVCCINYYLPDEDEDGDDVGTRSSKSGSVDLRWDSRNWCLGLQSHIVLYLVLAGRQVSSISRPDGCALMPTGCAGIPAVIGEAEPYTVVLD